MTRHTIGLLLGTEDDWPSAFTEILRRLGPVEGPGGPHAFDVERITIEPFSLRDRPRYDLVIDRLAYWYYHPREWLKKVAMMDGVYLLNSPFTFQSMEKHAAYCAMMRLGLKVPETVLVPYKNPIDNARYAYTAARYNQPFDLDAIAQKIGYPLFMKPYDGGAWRGVSRINNAGRAARRLRRQRRDAHAPAEGHRLRRLRPLAVHRRRDHGDEVPAGPAHAPALRGRARLPVPGRGARGGDDLASWSTRSSGGSSTPARPWSRAARSTPSTTPTPAPTSP